LSEVDEKPVDLTAEAKAGACAVQIPKKRALNLKLRVAGINVFEPVDMVSWLLVFLFFIVSALTSGGDLVKSFIGAWGIVVVMFVVGVSVEVIIECLVDVKGLGTLVGFITNGPEALCLIVGLIVGDILFAASTPLGSNFMNPLMLVGAALLTGTLGLTFRERPGYIFWCILISAGLAGGFFMVPAHLRLVWVLAAIPASLWLFVKRPVEGAVEENGDGGISRYWLLPAVAVLVVSGYLLDPVVGFAAEHSRAPKGVIGFFVLSTLTSWPEFKCTLSLLRRQRPMAAVLNITVSNLTNLWLAIIGIIVYLAI
jgi:cation:H+ antiporter